MKVRKGFVSNSSSSSFIVVGKDTVMKYFFPHIEYVELNKEQQERVIKQGFEIPKNENIYLTSFVSDSIDWNWKNSSDKNLVIEYSFGGHGSPYNEDAYEEIADDIYLLTDKKSSKSIDDLKQKIISLSKKEKKEIIDFIEGVLYED